MSEERIKVMVNGEIVEICRGTTAYDLVRKTDFITCKIGGVLSDLGVVLNGNDNIQLLTFDDLEGKDVFWHSSAHILGNALSRVYPNCKLVHGPPTSSGFFYDVDMDDTISSEDYKKIEVEMQKIIKENLKFEKVVLTKDEFLDMYKDNPCKTHFVRRFVEDFSTAYRNGDFVDMCQGPHLYSTGVIRAVKVMKSSSVYFLNDPSQKSLQRVYAVSFPTKEKLNKHLENLVLASKRDHRIIGQELDLFFFHKYSPGSCFFLPDGAHMYNKLIEFLRLEYRKRGFQEVITPNIYSTQLWQESGHLENYKDSIFMLENEDLGLKPMNCPGHCLLYRHDERSFRDLPLRYADFGVLHRNELSGTLGGLTRVRRFQQDDAHIFCTKDQIKSEIKSCLEFLDYVYRVFRFKFDLCLSTRPEKFLGTVTEWDMAEQALASAMDDLDMEYTLNQGDGAFYGPKIDITLRDALGRKSQCATIQLDFQLPQRFMLRYRSFDGSLQVPVIIHRAIFGSLERMLAILIENFGKNLPFWLSPRQIALIVLHKNKYVNEICDKLGSFRITVFNDKNTLSKKVRIAETKGYAVICVLGKKEEELKEVNVRAGKQNISLPVERFYRLIQEMEKKKLEFMDVFAMGVLEQGLENMKID